MQVLLFFANRTYELRSRVFDVLSSGFEINHQKLDRVVDKNSDEALKSEPKHNGEKQIKLPPSYLRLCAVI